MPIINTQKKAKKIKIKPQEIDENIYKEINDYCQWVGIDDVSFFIEEAARHVFKTDSDWKKHKKTLKENS